MSFYSSPGSAIHLVWWKANNTSRQWLERSNESVLLLLLTETTYVGFANDTRYSSGLVIEYWFYGFVTSLLAPLDGGYGTPRTGQEFRA